MMVQPFVRKVNHQNFGPPGHSTTAWKSHTLPLNISLEKAGWVSIGDGFLVEGFFHSWETPFFENYVICKNNEETVQDFSSVMVVT